ncbi:MAG: glycoside hydrolase family 75 protein, partial [Elusimicrobiota bacterium]|nr:glycoside hydrolase family 75 protein [Elusimicrobiota bacterium]
GGGPVAPGAGAAPRSGGAVASGSPGGETASSAGGADAFSRAAGGSLEKGGAGAAPRLGPMGADGVTRPKTEELKEIPSMSASSGAGGGPGAGGAGGGGGGGSGGGGSGGMGGAVPAGKPKASAGKPVEEGAAGGAPAGGPPTGGAGDVAGAGSFGPGGAPDPQTGTAKTGTLDVGEGVPSGHRFSLTPGGPAVIETLISRTKKDAILIEFKAKMAIDADGPGGGKDGDTTYQPETALQVSGKSLDARRTPFIVIPGDFKKAHKDVALGDFAAVTYGGKTYYAIVGDIGPKGVLGEASPVVARAVGIDPHPVSGGIRSASVRYYILPKSGRRPVPTGDAEIQSVVGAAFAAAGAELK